MADVESTLKRNLTPVEPAEAFRGRLWADFRSVAPRHAASPKAWLWLAAGVGGALSLTSLAVVAVRLGPALVARLAPRRGAPLAT
ncbi:MAG TPA: hypothetical protein PLC98_16645 [Anaerolineales bacterium]|nr:hypothetical protein [Anaerolineales bacterium]